MMFDVCDIWPDCAEAVGMLRNPMLVGTARFLEKRVYKRARRIGVVTRGFTGNIAAKGIPAGKIALLPDWVDPDTYDASRVDREAVREELQLGERFVVSFLGNFGLLMGIEKILEAARVVQERDPRVLFLFVGKGAALPMMEQRMREWNLKNVRIIPYQPRERVPALLAASDVLIVTYMQNDITLITVPSKIYEYMSIARPIVAGVDGVIREILEEAGCALVSQERDPRELAEHILALKADPDRGEVMGAAGRAYAQQHFAFRKVAADYELAVIETATGVPPRATAPAAVADAPADAVPAGE